MQRMIIKENINYQINLKEVKEIIRSVKKKF